MFSIGSSSFLYRGFRRHHQYFAEYVNNLFTGSHPPPLPVIYDIIHTQYFLKKKGREQVGMHSQLVLDHENSSS